jgi:dTDP-4-amino-4,6-dideoxygalactose transaminase
MSNAALAPVRRAVPVQRGDHLKGQAALAALLGTEQVWLYGSGTDALQAVLSHCAAQRCGQWRDEVILPAYGCPDLVTACIGAGLRPLLVDVDESGWGYGPAALTAALSTRTAAVVAVNLLGVGDDALRLRRLITDPQVMLIQDSAQYLPRTPTAWIGDFQIFSFGRGKPLNLLGGGAATVAPQSRCESSQSLLAWLLGSRLGALLFNAATAPPIYRLLCQVPGLGIGTTRYRDPQPVRQAPARLAGQLDVALPDWVRHPSYSVARWQMPLQQWMLCGVTPLTCADGSLNPPALLRLPLLAPCAEMRDVLVGRLAAEGLGATALYGTALHHASAIPQVVSSQGPFPAAESLARRLFTLPTHSGVTTAAVHRTDVIVREVAASLYAP